MNERIQKLAEQAGLLYKQFGPTVETRYMKKKEQDLEKFAELIVRECANIFGREDTGEYQVDGNWIAKTIKQHFGVDHE